MSEIIITKRCGHCKKTKPISKFYKDSARKNGIRCQCKYCCNKGQKTEKVKDYHCKYTKKYQKTKKGKAIAKCYMQSEKGKQMFKRYCFKHPDRRQAKVIVNNAIASGNIQPAKTYNCKCGKQAQQYHHPDYSKPLYIIPVCVKCHKEFHYLSFNRE